LLPQAVDERYGLLFGQFLFPRRPPPLDFLLKPLEPLADYLERIAFFPRLPAPFDFRPLG
jgi:hypothetical protein